MAYADFRAGLGQAAMHEESAGDAGTEVKAKPVHEYSREEVKGIRKACGLTQVLFAAFLGVSVKTIEAWESGRNCPTGPASRLLSFAEKDPQFPFKSGLLSVSKECGVNGMNPTQG